MNNNDWYVCEKCGSSENLVKTLSEVPDLSSCCSGNYIKVEEDEYE